MNNLLLRLTPGLVFLITAVFITLKLTGVIHWSWWFVLLPLWIPVPASLIWVLVFGSLALIVAWFNHKFLKARK